MTLTTRLRRPAVILALLTAYPTPSQADASPAGFVAAKASWNGDVLTVSFRETGLSAAAKTTISVAARGSLNAVCKRAGNIVMSVYTTGTVRDVSEYTAAEDGSVDGARALRLSVSMPASHSLDCVLAATRLFSVALHDRTTGAATEIHGQDPPGRADRQR